jgi:hypothetical protein
VMHKGQQAGKLTAYKCHWCGGRLNLSGHRTIEDDGREIVTTYLVGVDCLVKYRRNMPWESMAVSVQCESQQPHAQGELF